MPPSQQGLVHPPKYDWRDSNVSLINSSLDHKLKHHSAATEPAWNPASGPIGTQPGLFIWRIEDFRVVAWPREDYGSFHEGDSYIVLYSEKAGSSNSSSSSSSETQAENRQHDQVPLLHEIFFWLGSLTSQDEAGTAAYKTVELDEFLGGAATQHRELQTAPSPAFQRLFPRLRILRGGVASGFRHVDVEARESQGGRHVDMLMRVFKQGAASAAAGGGEGRKEGLFVYEVEPSWKSLDEDDVFILDKGDKIFVWQGRNCSPMEKMRAAQVVSDMTAAKHVEVEVVAQTESRSQVVVDYLGGQGVDAVNTTLRVVRPITAAAERHTRKLFQISDAAAGDLSFRLVKQGAGMGRADLDGNDVFLLDAGHTLWVWEGRQASRAEKSLWLTVVQKYISSQQDAAGVDLAKVKQGSEKRAFWTALEA